MKAKRPAQHCHFVCVNVIAATESPILRADTYPREFMRNSTRRALLILVAAAFAACDSPAAPERVAPELASFSFTRANNPALSADALGTISGDTVTVVLPNVVGVTALVPTFTTSDAGATVWRGNAAQTSGTSAADFTRDVTYRIEARGGTAKQFVVRVIVFTGLPVVTVTTDGGAPILNREDYVAASVSIYGGKNQPQFNFSAPTQIRGRGNSTWHNPKKPYRLKLTSSASLFGFPADRDWTLLANYWDQSLARNALAFQLGSMMTAIGYNPRCTPVELVLNGAHQGAYQLCDHVEVATNRVPATNAGWFLEIVDFRRIEADETWFRSTALDAWSMQSDPTPSVWVYKQPDPPSATQRATVEGDIRRLEEVLYGAGFAHPDTGYAKYLDVDALIDWYIVQELSKNNDAAFFNSTYVYKTPTGKIVVGPLWDFDLAFGNYAFDAGPTGWKIRNSAWVERLFEDRAFIGRLKTRWQALYARRGEVDRWITDYTRSLEHSQRLTHPMWLPYAPLPLLRMDGFGETDLSQPRVRTLSDLWTDADYANEVTELRTWLNTRWAWLHTGIMDL